jgi:hypothetical protein
MGATKSALCLADAVLEQARPQLCFLIQNTHQSKLSSGNHRIFVFELHDVYALFISPDLPRHHWQSATLA